MDAGAAAALSPVFFEDGLGQRRHFVGAGNQPLSVLILNEELTAASSFEVTLRDRVAQLAGFQHASYARVRGIGHLTRASSLLALASDHVPGIRLSEILAVAEKRLIPLEIDAAFCLIRQLVAAVAALHDRMPQACHGALAPERIIVTPDLGLVVVEHVLGTALERLRFSQEGYWTKLRVALPLTGPPCFDRRADVMQIGAVALALILGRRLGEHEYPARIADLADNVRAISGTGLELLPASLHSWLRGLLQLDARRSFASAVEAQAALEGVRGADEHQEREALKSFLVQCCAEPVPSAATSSGGAPFNSVPFREADPPAEPRAARPPAPAETEAPDDVYHGGWETSEQTEVHMYRRTVRRRGRLIAAAMVLIALASAGMLAARRYLRPDATRTGTLIVDTSPPGLRVAIDGQERGVTPLTVALHPGSHMLEVAGGGQVRGIPVTMTAGGQVAQFIELSGTAPAPVVGQLQVRTDPPGARVRVDAEFRGMSPLTIQDLTPGVHTVTLEDAVRSVTEQVTIDPGATASLVVPLTAPPGASLSGWISIAAPVDVQVYENEHLLGSSLSDRIMVPVGRHQLDIVNEALGYRSSRAVQVTPGNVARITLDWPKGSMALNALPWAEVWVDGERMGETPIGSVSVPIGPHEIVFRHPDLGEQAHRITVTLAAPVRVSADLRKR